MCTQVKDIMLIDVTPLTLGVETDGGVFSPVMERGTAVPWKVRSQWGGAVSLCGRLSLLLQGDEGFHNLSRCTRCHRGKFRTMHLSRCAAQTWHPTAWSGGSLAGRASPSQRQQEAGHVPAGWNPCGSQRQQQLSVRSSLRSEDATARCCTNRRCPQD